MLKNAYFLAKIGADTAENEQQFAEILPIDRRVAALTAASPVMPAACALAANLWKPVGGFRWTHYDSTWRGGSLFILPACFRKNTFFNHKMNFST